jgi:hypothetical protein
MGLATSQIFGEHLDCQDLIFPGSAGTPAALSGRSSCFWVFVLGIGAIRLTQGFGLVAIRVNAGRSGHRTQRAPTTHD